MIVLGTLDEGRERTNDQPGARVRPRECRVVREDHAEVRPAAKADFLHEPREVAHVVRHDDASLTRGRSKHRLIVLALEVRSLPLYRHGIDIAPAELLRDRGVVLLVEQEPQAFATRRRVRVSRCSRTCL